MSLLVVDSHSLLGGARALKRQGRGERIVNYDALQAIDDLQCDRKVVLVMFDPASDKQGAFIKILEGAGYIVYRIPFRHCQMVDPVKGVEGLSMGAILSYFLSRWVTTGEIDSCTVVTGASELLHPLSVDKEMADKVTIAFFGELSTWFVGKEYFMELGPEIDRVLELKRKVREFPSLMDLARY
jgi:hypothetical protein